MTTPAKITHHLPTEVLIAYSAGTLPEAHSLLVATHLSLCDECRAAAEANDVLGAALMEEIPAQPLPDEILSAVFARIDREPAAPAAPARRPRDGIPGVLLEYIGGGLDDVRWQNLGGGVRQHVLKTGGKGSARLLYIPGGKAVPDHGHRGLELTLVLRGAFVDGDERFGAGDVEVADDDTVHQPIAEAGEACICLATTEAPLRFRGLVPRLLQPIFRI